MDHPADVRVVGGGNLIKSIHLFLALEEGELHGRNG